MLQLYLVLLDETTGILASTLFHSCADERLITGLVP